ncbi:ribonuclease H-like domain-containing protein [Hypomontagnella monticulosa]|nr:ribonuclease H-like domain-containing protein [Hypomontagnella monticulosa]
MATSTSTATIATLISSTAELEAFISSISTSSKLYIDLEGNNLCRHGTISLITILLHPQKIVRVIDVISLGEASFTTTSKDGKSLKSIFEDPDIPKCLWDVRNDADALWAHYKVGLAGVVDIQLLENASRAGEKTYLRGLDKAIQFDLSLGFMERNLWIRSKKETKSLMSSNIFSARPVEAKTLQYCANDVIHLPELHALYLRRISRDWLAKAKEQSSRRVEEAHSPAYVPQSASKALGPWGSGAPKGLMTLDEFCDALEDQAIEDREREMLGDYDQYDDYYDDGPTSCRDIIDDCDYHYYYSD